MRSPACHSLALAAVAVTAAALALSACGGEPGRAARVDTEITTPTVAEPSDSAQVTDPARAKYVRRVDAVCARINPEREKALSDVGDAKSDSEANKAYDRSIALAEEQLKGVEAISPPAADREVIASNVIARLRTRLTLRRKLRADLADNDATSAQRDRAELDALTIALRSFARGYGFRVCGER